MNRLPTNAVHLGNELFVQVQLFPKQFDEYHISDGNKLLNVKIAGNIVTWLIPKSVFENQEYSSEDDNNELDETNINHIKFKLNIYSNSDSKCLVEFRKSTLDNDGFGFIVNKGFNSVYSWAKDGGDFCLLKPKTSLNTAITKHFKGEITKLYLTTFKELKKNEHWNTYSSIQSDGSQDVCDGPIPIHFATVGKSTQRLKISKLNEDSDTAVFTEFHFECI